jgi:tape measure domain-containing protein
MAQKEEFILSLEDKQFLQGLVNARKSTRGLRKSVSSTDDSVRKLTNSLRAIASIAVFKNVVAQLGQATFQMQAFQQQLKFTQGSSEAGGKALDFVRKEADKLGLSLEASIPGFAKFSAAAKGTEIEGKGVKTVFNGVTAASAAMRLTGEQTAGAFTALEQIMSKGKVQAEELRGQLGERIPGAFQIAARAMGVTTKELDKMLETGSVLANDFLPAFGNQLKIEFGEAAIDASTSAQAGFERFKNELFETKAALGEAFLGEGAGAVSGLRDLLKTVRANIGLIKKFIKLVAVIGAGFLAYKAAVIGVRLALRLARIAQGAYIISLNLIKGNLARATAAMKLFNIAAKSNPIGLLIGILASVGAAYAAFAGDVAGANVELDEFQRRNAEIQQKQKEISGFDFKDLSKTQLEDFVIPKQEQVISATQSQILSLKSELGQLRDVISGGQRDTDESKVDFFGREFKVGKGVREELRESLGSPLEKDLIKKISEQNKTLLEQKKILKDALEAAKIAPNGGGAGGGSGSGSGSLKSGISEIRSAAPKNFTINIDSLIKEQTISTETIEQSESELKDKITEILLTALNDVQVISR